MSPALAKLRAREPVRAIWLSLGLPALAEIAAEAAPDAIVLDCQHGDWSRGALLAAAAAARPATPLVRVAANTPEAIGTALDAGADGVIVPLVETAEAARAAIAAAHYPPHGIRSGGGLRPLRDFGGYVAASRQTLVAVMVETAVGLANIAEIAANIAFDTQSLVFIGPGDLALSVGADAVEPAIAQILAACQAANVPCGIFTSGPETASRRLAQGFALVVADDDIRLARTGFAASLKAVT